KRAPVAKIDVGLTSERSKLLEEAHVVLNEETDIAYPVFPHRDSFDAEAEGPAGIEFGVDADGFEDVGVNHAAAAELDPLALVLEPDIHLGRWLGEGEEAGAE